MPNVRMVWGLRKNGTDTPELMTAWDEYALEENFAGFERDKAEQIQSWGDELHSVIEVEVYIPYEPLLERLNPPLLKFDGSLQGRHGLNP